MSAEINAIKTKLPNSMHQVSLHKEEGIIKVMLNRFTKKKGNPELSKSAFVFLSANDAVILSNILLAYAKELHNNKRRFKILEKNREDFIQYSYG